MSTAREYCTRVRSWIWLESVQFKTGWETELCSVSLVKFGFKFNSISSDFTIISRPKIEHLQCYYKNAAPTIKQQSHKETITIIIMHIAPNRKKVHKYSQDFTSCSRANSDLSPSPKVGVHFSDSNLLPPLSSTNPPTQTIREQTKEK